MAETTRALRTNDSHPGQQVLMDQSSLTSQFQGVMQLPQQDSSANVGKRSGGTVLTSKCPLKKLSGHLDVVGDVPGQQIVDPVNGVVGNARQHFPQVSF